MVILTEGYDDGAQRDWLRAMRLKRKARYGMNRVKPEYRLYIKDDSVLLFIPYGVKVYKDDKGRYFIDRRDVEGWERLKDFLGGWLVEGMEFEGKDR